MIDTIHFAIPLSSLEYKAIQNKGKESIIIDKTLGTEIKRQYKDNLYLGSHDYRINYWCDDPTTLFLKLSIPKYVYGHNIYLLYPAQLEQALAGVYHALVKHFGVFPHYMNWRLQRLDICYAWKYQNHDTAVRLLKLLKTLDYPRKTKIPYETGVMWKGEKYSVKFYLKKDDFRVHDFKRYFKHDQELAYKLLDFCSGILRFEVTIRKCTLDYIFENKSIVTYKDIENKNFIPSLLNQYLTKLLGYFNKDLMTDKDIVNNLVATYGKSKGMRAYGMYELCFSPNANKLFIVKEHYSQHTIWRYKRMLRNANIGISNLYDLNIDIQIPSTYVVNPEPACDALASSSQGLPLTYEYK